MFGVGTGGHVEPIVHRSTTHPVDAKLATDRDVLFEAMPLDRVTAAIDGAKGAAIKKLFRLLRDDEIEATPGRQEPHTCSSLPGREDFFFVSRQKNCSPISLNPEDIGGGLPPWIIVRQPWQYAKRR